VSRPFISQLPRAFQLLIVGLAAFSGAMLAVQVAQSAGSSSTKIVANRVVVPPGAGYTNVLTIPGLGVVRGTCGSVVSMVWFNSTSGPVDAWNSMSMESPETRDGLIVSSGLGLQVAALVENDMRGGEFELGKGTNPGARKTATVTVNAYRSPNDWCGFQATAVTWTHT